MMLHQDWQPRLRSGGRGRNYSLSKSVRYSCQTFSLLWPYLVDATDKRRKEQVRSKSIVSATRLSKAVERHQRAGKGHLHLKLRRLRQPASPIPKLGLWERKSYISRSVLKNGIDAFSANDSSTLEQVVDSAANSKIQTDESNHTTNVPLN